MITLQNEKLKNRTNNFGGIKLQVTNRRRITFYEAAYLVACDTGVLIEPDGRQSVFTVDDTPLIDGYLALFASNAELQKFTKGIVQFRRQFKDFHNEQKRNKNNQNPVETVEIKPAPPENEGHL